MCDVDMKEREARYLDYLKKEIERLRSELSSDRNMDEDTLRVKKLELKLCKISVDGLERPLKKEDIDACKRALNRFVSPELEAVTQQFVKSALQAISKTLSYIKDTGQMPPSRTGEKSMVDDHWNVEGCFDCTHFDDSIDIDPCATCLREEKPIFFEARRCWTCKHNEVDPERDPCRKCAFDGDIGEGHTGWEVGEYVQQISA